MPPTCQHSVGMEKASFSSRVTNYVEPFQMVQLFMSSPKGQNEPLKVDFKCSSSGEVRLKFNTFCTYLRASTQMLLMYCRLVKNTPQSQLQTIFNFRIFFFCGFQLKTHNKSDIVQIYFIFTPLSYVAFVFQRDY